MTGNKPDVRFVVIFGFVWLGFGIYGLVAAPERQLVAASQFVLSGAHFVYAFWLWRKFK